MSNFTARTSSLHIYIYIYVHSFNQNRKQSVTLEGTISTLQLIFSLMYINCMILFQTYINDVLETATSSETKLFACYFDPSILDWQQPGAERSNITGFGLSGFMVFNATFNNISVVS